MPTILPPESDSSTINQQKRYIATEFLRYFPDASRIDVWHERDGEIIQVRIWGPIDPKDDMVSYIDNFSFECSSDDDWYVFGSEQDMLITIPLQSF